ncbi:MAG: hypothetical protein FD129_488, partial [bacterium]
MKRTLALLMTTTLLLGASRLRGETGSDA